VVRTAPAGEVSQSRPFAVLYYRDGFPMPAIASGASERRCQGDAIASNMMPMPSQTRALRLFVRAEHRDQPACYTSD